MIDRALQWTDKLPKLVESGPGDYDNTTYHPGWQYWETHSKMIMCSSNYDRVLEYKSKIENREIHVANWTNRPHRLQIVCVETRT